MDKFNGNNQEGGRQTRRCASCQREFGMGDDALLLQHGVIGPRGFVPLDDKTYLCDHVCLAEYVNGSGKTTERLPRRIP